MYKTLRPIKSKVSPLWLNNNEVKSCKEVVLFITNPDAKNVVSLICNNEVNTLPELISGLIRLLK